MKNNLEVIETPQNIIIVVERTSRLIINSIYIQFRPVLPAADVITLLPHYDQCYSYGIITLPWE
jgi:hypothetical protein